jgi:hypothetical protein
MKNHIKNGNSINYEYGDIIKELFKNNIIDLEFGQAMLFKDENRTHQIYQHERY